MAYFGRLADMIEKGVVKTDQIYMIDGKAVVFRKTRRDRDCDRSIRHEYSFEILPMASETKQESNS